jgi:hypothetical protein
MQHQQRRRISPLQVLHHQRHRVLDTERLDEGDEPLHDPELGLGSVRQPPPADAGARILPKQPGNRCPPALGGRAAGGQAVGDHAERPPPFQLIRGTVKDPDAKPICIGEPLGDDAGLPDPRLTDHHQCPTGAVSDLPHRRPELVELGGATGQTAIWMGVDSSRHRDRLPDRLPVDGTHVAELEDRRMDRRMRKGWQPAHLDHRT